MQPLSALTPVFSGALVWAASLAAVVQGAHLRDEVLSSQPDTKAAFNATQMAATYFGLGLCDADPCFCCWPEAHARAEAFSNVALSNPPCKDILRKLHCTFECLPHSPVKYDSSEGVAQLEVCGADCSAVAAACTPAPVIAAPPPATTASPLRRRLLQVRPAEPSFQNAEEPAAAAAALAAAAAAQPANTAAAAPVAPVAPAAPAAPAAPSTGNVSLPPLWGGQQSAPAVVGATALGEVSVEVEEVCKTLKLPMVNVTVVDTGLIYNTVSAKELNLTLVASNATGTACLSKKPLSPKNATDIAAWWQAVNRVPSA